MRKNRLKRLPVATAWPDNKVSDEEFAQWAETHSLEKLIGTAKRVPIKSLPRAVPEDTKRQQEAFERLLIVLGMSRKDVEAARRIARKKDIAYTVLLRSWIREGLKREQQRAAG